MTISIWICQYVLSSGIEYCPTYFCEILFLFGTLIGRENFLLHDNKISDCLNLMIFKLKFQSICFTKIWYKLILQMWFPQYKWISGFYFLEHGKSIQESWRYHRQGEADSIYQGRCDIRRWKVQGSLCHQGYNYHRK